MEGFNSCQQVIDGFIVGFYRYATGVIAEIDEEVHQKQADYDQERDRILAARGLWVLHIQNWEVLENLPEVLNRAAAACRAAAEG